jgi:phage tail-like protein
MNRTTKLLLAGLVLALACRAADAAEFAGTRTTKVMGAAQRIDPYKNYRVLILMHGRVVAGASSVNGLDSDTADVAEYRAGDDHSGVLKIPGTRKFGDVTLKRGVVQDSDFWNWLKNARGNGKRKDLTIVLRDEAGHLKGRYVLHRSWVSKIQAPPHLDSRGSDVAVEELVLSHEGIDLQPPP